MTKIALRIFVAFIAAVMCTCSFAASDVTAKTWSGLTRGWDGRYYSNPSRVPALTAPSSLSANASGSTITVSWTDNTSGVAQTLIQRSPDGSSSWVDITTVAAATTSYQNTGLADGTYYYRAYATYSSQQSAASGTANATVSASGSVITSITGSVTDGSTVTVNGSGFGTMGGDVIGYHRGDEGSNGEVLHGDAATVGTIDTYVIGTGDDTTGDHLRYSNTVTRGNKSVVARRVHDGTISGSYHAGGYGWTGFNTTKYYATFYAYNAFTWNTTNSYNYKMFYSFGSSSNMPQTMLFHPASNNSTGFYNNNAYTPDSFNVENMMNTASWTGPQQDNTWLRWEIYADFANTPTTRDGVLRVWRNNELGISSDTWLGRGCLTSGCPTPGLADTTYTRQFYLGYMDLNMTGLIRYFTDLYIASTRARIEVCDASTYTASTHCELQLAREANWTNTAISSVVLNRGSFANFTGTYMYVILSNGATLTNTGFAL